jgi:hypothetical protein
MFKNNYDVNLDELQSHMLYKLDDPHLNLKDNKKTDLKKLSNNIYIKSDIKVPRSQIQINYNKKYSKYHEPFTIKNNNKFKDKLFWCFYKLLKQFCDSDLDNINSFTLEKQFKFDMVEKIRNNKAILKSAKIQKTAVEDDLVNSEVISYKTFNALCLYHKINIVIIRNTTYTIIDNNLFDWENFDFEKNNIIDIILDNKFKILELKYDNDNKFSKNFEIDEIKVTDEKILSIFNSYYFIKTLDKPLKSISSYKVDELLDICNKLKININDIHGKRKTKQILYENIQKILN